MDKMDLQEALEHEYLCGIADGKKMYEQYLIDALESETPIKVNDKSYMLVATNEEGE